MWIEKWPEGMWCSRVLRINDKKIYKEVRTNTIIKWEVGTNIVFLAQNDTDALSKLQSLCRLSLQCGIAGILICIYNSKLGQWVIYREFDVFYSVLCPIASHILNECDGTLNYGFRDSPPAEQSHLSSPTSSLWWRGWSWWGWWSHYNVTIMGVGTTLCPNPKNGLFQCF